MKATGVVRRIDDLGRIVIPKEIRRLVFGKADAIGEPMEIFIDGENVVLRRYKAMQTCEWIKYDYRNYTPHITLKNNVPDDFIIPKEIEKKYINTTLYSNDEYIEAIQN